MARLGVGASEAERSAGGVMKRRIFAFISIVIGASNAYACIVAGEKDGLPVFKNCPSEIVDFLNRSVICQHFGGEITGDPASGRDKEVYDAMALHKCDQLRKDKKSILATYESDAAVQAVIQQTFKSYGIEL